MLGAIVKASTRDTQRILVWFYGMETQQKENCCMIYVGTQPWTGGWSHHFLQKWPCKSQVIPSISRLSWKNRIYDGIIYDSC